MFQIIWEYRQAFLKGLRVTLELAGVTWFVGLVVGSVLGIAASRWQRSLGLVARAIAFILSGIPILVMLFWLHYPAQELLHVVIDPFYTAAAALALVNVFTVEEIVRAAVGVVPREFRDAGRVCGLSPREVLFSIEMPLIVRHVISPLLVSQVAMLHMTLFASVISVDEILRMAQRVNAKIYEAIPIYSAIALFFLVVSLPVNGVALVLGRRFGRDLSER